MDANGSVYSSVADLARRLDAGEEVAELPALLTLFASIAAKARLASIASALIDEEHADAAASSTEETTGDDDVVIELSSPTIASSLLIDEEHPDAAARCTESEINGGDIDFSSRIIGDAGCMALSASLASATGPGPSLESLDLESNGLSWVGASALADALRGRAAPMLAFLDLSCNNIGPQGSAALASALALGCCPHLGHLDLHGNAIGDDGCVALGAAFASGALPDLALLDLSANRIENRGCAALAPLFGGGSACRADHRRGSTCCPLLTVLILRENGIETIASIIRAEESRVVVEVETELEARSPLTFLDVSWNCITDFGALSGALGSSLCPSLEKLDLRGNSLGDAGCLRLLASLRACGATPLLRCYGASEDVAGTGKDEEVEGGEGQLRRCLRLLADGDATNPRVCSLALWQDDTEDAESAGIHPIPSVDIRSSIEKGSVCPFDLIRRDGYIVRPPLCPRPQMARLASLMERIDRARWPPVFCFMNDALWELVTTHVWPAVSALMGVDCVLDVSSAFAWSLKANGRSTYPRDGEFREWQNACSSTNVTERVDPNDPNGGIGSSFGLPHRDYSGTDSIRVEAEDEAGSSSGTKRDHPNLLSVWIPLNDATLENGCMYVVPREFDVGFAKTDDHAHMNPATEVRRGLSSKIRFPLHGARALPAPAGSMLAWYGNTIHWGSTCSRFASQPRKSIAITFQRSDIVTPTTFTSEEACPALVHNPAPAITVEQARAMTPRMRLELVSRSLLVYNQWHALADDAVPPLLFDTTASK